MYRFLYPLNRFGSFLVQQYITRTSGVESKDARPRRPTAQRSKAGALHISSRWRPFARAAQALKSPARRAAAGRYLSGLHKSGRARDLLEEAIGEAKGEARARGLTDGDIDDELEAWLNEHKTDRRREQRCDVHDLLSMHPRHDRRAPLTS
jgi:hypothetical protein